MKNPETMSKTIPSGQVVLEITMGEGLSIRDLKETVTILRQAADGIEKQYQKLGN